MNVSQAALETHIRGSIIEALEAGNYQLLPPMPYIRGLLRNYALFLGLDPEPVLEDYAQEINPQPLPPSPYESALFDVPPPPVEETLFPPAPSSPIYVPPSRANPLTPTIGPAPLYSSQMTQPPLVAAAPAPIFQVAPESISAASVPPPDPPTLIQWISNTRIPEIVAIVAVGITVLALGIFAYSRLLPGSPTPRAASVLANLTATTTPTPRETASKSPTPVPVLETAGSPLVAVPTATARQAGAAPATLAPGSTPHMTLEITANETMWVLVIVDDVEVFKGELKGTTESWTANERLYFLVKDLPNGTVVFNDKDIKANVFAERQLIERAWQWSSKGTVISMSTAPFHVTPTLSPTRTATPAPTNTPLPAATSVPPIAPPATAGPTETPAG